MIVLDYTKRIDPVALKAAGASDVSRYISWPVATWKTVTKQEFEELANAGLGITLNWEWESDDWLGGSTAGLLHVNEAVRVARELGYPAGCTIIGSADFNMSRAQWDSAGKAYAQAFSGAIVKGGYRAGAYGPYNVLKWCSEEVPNITVFWQAGISWAWDNNNQDWPGAHFIQTGHKQIAGQDTDWSQIVRPNWGQYRRVNPMVDLNVEQVNEDADRARWTHPRIYGFVNLAPQDSGPEKGGVLPVVELLKRVDETVKTMADGFVAEIQIEPAQFEELATKVRTGLATEIVNAIVERLANG